MKEIFKDIEKDEEVDKDTKTKVIVTLQRVCNVLIELIKTLEKDK